MQNVLVSVESDLPSKIALRFACQLGRLAEMTLFPIHVVETENKGDQVGKGWVHKTWEDSVFHGIKNRINRIVKDEKSTCSIIAPPRFTVGEREKEIKNELKLSHYDLFVEGLFHSFQPDTFYKKLSSSLYRKGTCPVLLVKNWTGTERGIIITGEKKISDEMIDTFFKLCGKTGVEPEIILINFDGDKEDKSSLKKVEEAFALRGKKFKAVCTISGDIEKISSSFRNTSLIITELPKKGSRMEELLGSVPCSILFSR